MNIPNPGSDAAIKQGCTYPVLDNAHGRGIMGDGEKHGYWITSARRPRCTSPSPCSMT